MTKAIFLAEITVMEKLGAAVTIEALQRAIQHLLDADTGIDSGLESATVKVSLVSESREHQAS
jgi:hypothetical protein